jgi:hypothetical protein
VWDEILHVGQVSNSSCKQCVLVHLQFLAMRCDMNDQTMQVIIVKCSIKVQANNAKQLMSIQVIKADNDDYEST